MQVLVPIAHGSESLETVTLVNVLRRAEIAVILASTEDELVIKATRDIQLLADCLFDTVIHQTFEAIVLPGGEPGARRLGAHKGLVDKLNEQRIAHRWYGAVCAAPALTLSPNGLLDGKQATCHPSFREHLLHYVEQAVVIDGHCISSQGPGTTMAFALTWIEQLLGKEASKAVAQSMLVPQ